jgi:hypothetical protein
MSKEEEEQKRNQQLVQLQAQMAQLGVQVAPASAADDSQTKHAFWDTQVRYLYYMIRLLTSLTRQAANIYV